MDKHELGEFVRHEFLDNYSNYTNFLEVIILFVNRCNLPEKHDFMIAKTPPPPYYAVIFTSLKTSDDAGYNETSTLMVELAMQQTGYLGHESARDGIGITVSYWQSLEAIKAWKQQTDHLLAQKMGKQQWYECYKTRICLVERDYSFEK